MTRWRSGCAGAGHRKKLQRRPQENGRANRDKNRESSEAGLFHAFFERRHTSIAGAFAASPDLGPLTRRLKNGRRGNLGFQKLIYKINSLAGSFGTNLAVEGIEVKSRFAAYSTLFLMQGYIFMLNFARFRTLCGVTLAAFALAVPAISQAQSGYTVIDLGTLGGAMSFSNSINASGQVTGFSSVATDDLNHAFLWTGTTMTALSVPDAGESIGSSVNNSGAVAGLAYHADGSGFYAALWKDGAFTPLDMQGALYGVAAGINSSGQTSGTLLTGTSAGIVAARWTGTTPDILASLGGFNSQCFGINDSGQVTGFSRVASRTAYHAVRWTGTAVTDLGTLGGTSSYGYSINANGTIAGWSNTTGDAARHAVIWTGTTATDLGTLGGTDCEGRGINLSGDVVGDSTLASGVQNAFLYSVGHMVNLNSLLPSGSEWELTNARSINVNGWITGQGTINGQQHAYILRPNAVPEPSTLSFLVGLATIGASLLRKRPEG